MLATGPLTFEALFTGSITSLSVIPRPNNLNTAYSAVNITADNGGTLVGNGADVCIRAVCTLQCAMSFFKLTLYVFKLPQLCKFVKVLIVISGQQKCKIENNRRMYSRSREIVLASGCENWGKQSRAIHYYCEFYLPKATEGDTLKTDHKLRNAEKPQIQL